MSRNVPGGRRRCSWKREGRGLPEPAETDMQGPARSRDEKGSEGSDSGSAPKLSIQSLYGKRR